MVSKYSRLAKNTGIVFIGNAGSKLIAFLMLPFYTHFLSVESFGISDMVNTYSSILFSFVTCCLADAIFVYPKKASEHDRTGYFTSGFIFVVFGFILLASVYLLIDNFEFKYSLGVFYTKFWWIFGLTLSMYMQNYMQQFTMSIGKMLHYSITGLVMTAMTAILAFVLLPKYGLDGYLWSLIGAHILSALYPFFFAKLYRYFSIKEINYNLLKQLLAYGIPLIPNSVMWWLVSGINRPLMEKYIGLTAVGIFAVANRFPSVLSMLFSVFGNAWNVSVIEEFETKEFNDFFNRTLKVMLYMVSIAGCLISACSKWIVSIFTSVEYYSAWRFIPLLTLGVILQCMSSLVGSIFMAEKKSKYFFYSSVWSATASLCMTLITIRLWGITGACIAVAFSFLVLFVVRLYYAWNKINHLSIVYYLQMFTCYILMVCGIMTDTSIYISIIVTIGVILYMTMLNRHELIVIANKMQGKVKRFF